VPFESVFDERCNFRLFNNGRCHLSCRVFLCLFAIPENPAGNFVDAVDNWYTERLLLIFLFAAGVRSFQVSPESDAEQYHRVSVTRMSAERYFSSTRQTSEGVISESSKPWQVKLMSIATDILSLRQNQSSSVETLMAKIEWLKAAEEEAHISSREFGVREAADIVLLNVATHAAEALNEPPVIHRTRRALSISRRKQRHSDPGRLHPRSLYYHVQ